MPSGGFVRNGQRAKRKSSQTRADDSINQLCEAIPKIHLKRDLPPEGTHRIQRTTAVGESTMVWVGEPELAISFLAGAFGRGIIWSTEGNLSVERNSRASSKGDRRARERNAAAAEEAAANAELFNQVRALLAKDRR